MAETDDTRQGSPRAIGSADSPLRYPDLSVVVIDALRLAWEGRRALLGLFLVHWGLQGAVQMTADRIDPEQADGPLLVALLLLAIVLSALVLNLLVMGATVVAGLRTAEGPPPSLVACLRLTLQRFFPVALAILLLLTLTILIFLSVIGMLQVAMEHGFLATLPLLLLLVLAFYVCAIAIVLVPAVCASERPWSGFRLVLELTRGRRWSGTVAVAILVVVFGFVFFLSGLFGALLGYVVQTFDLIAWSNFFAQAFLTSLLAVFFGLLQVSLFLHLRDGKVFTRESDRGGEPRKS